MDVNTMMLYYWKKLIFFFKLNLIQLMAEDFYVLGYKIMCPTSNDLLRKQLYWINCGRFTISLLNASLRSKNKWIYRCSEAQVLSCWIWVLTIYKFHKTFFFTCCFLDISKETLVLQVIQVISEINIKFPLKLTLKKVILLLIIN